MNVTDLKSMNREGQVGNDLGRQCGARSSTDRQVYLSEENGRPIVVNSLFISRS